jgi:hypothetical protein
VDVVPERYEQAGMAVPLLEAELDGAVADPGTRLAVRSLAVLLGPASMSPTDSMLVPGSRGTCQTLTLTASDRDWNVSRAGLSRSPASAALQFRPAGISVQSGGWPTSKPYWSDV